jgi:hypothetical protein
MAEYKLLANGAIYHRPTHTSFLPVGENADYQAYLAWLEAGGVPDPAMTVDEAKAAKVAELRAACAGAIASGCIHTALGTPHTYPMSTTDQTNYLGRVAQAQMDPGGLYNLWCADADGLWAKRPHTAVQTIAVALAAAATVQQCSDRLSGEDGLGGLLKAVTDAETLAEVEAVVW